jgi:hypothetical protein
LLTVHTKLYNFRDEQDMHGAHQALSSSLQVLGGSAAMSRFSFSALRKEVHKILAQKRRAIASFEDERLQDILKVRNIGGRL